MVGLIDDLAIHLAASKNADFQARAKERFFRVITFLQENDLTVRNILEPGEEPSRSTKIMRSDLTDDGYEVVQAAYDKWLRGIDRGKSMSDLSIFEAALKKVRALRDKGRIQL